MGEAERGVIAAAVARSFRPRRMRSTRRVRSQAADAGSCGSARPQGAELFSRCGALTGHPTARNSRAAAINDARHERGVAWKHM